ncbi:MAG: RNA chaperone Hfq [Abditibacteriales bacterium]|nr:RNA chaperone Hfq [Abditibacteriales bacterium]MDW8365858.1 RNA chaperone Hfq [Abditibacteriales bacterium]
MASSPGNLQDNFLNGIRKENVGVVIYLTNGSQLRGNIKAFDNFTLLLESNGKLQLVYKHAVSTISPVRSPGEGRSEGRSSRGVSRNQKAEE